MNKVTLKLDKHNRLCAWPGNVQSQIYTDDNNQLVVRNVGALFRLDRELLKMHIISYLASNQISVLSDGGAIVVHLPERLILTVMQLKYV